MNAALSGFMSKEDASILATTNASTTNARALPIVPKFCDVLLLGTLLLFALELGFAFQLHDYQLFERIPGKASDVVASWGGQLYFVYLPAIHHLSAGDRNIPSRAPVLALVQRLGIPVIDVHRVFFDHPDPESLRFYYGSHTNEAGYELHAKTILATLGSPDPPVAAAGDAHRLQ